MIIKKEDKDSTKDYFWWDDDLEYFDDRKESYILFNICSVSSLGTK